MVTGDRRWGTDLRLLDDLSNQDDRSRGADLFTRRRVGTGQLDLELVAELDNLRQALLLRFLTQRGELAVLGHPDYGSRLHELVGLPNTESTRNRAKMFALTTLAAEPRVEEVLAVDVRVHPGDRSRVDIDARLRVRHGDSPLNLVFGFSLEGGVLV
jgi:phage baseplate assembly protein W